MAEEPTIQMDVSDIPTGDVEAESTATTDSSAEEAKTEEVTLAEEPAAGAEAESEGDDESGADDPNAEDPQTDQPKFETAEARKEALNSEIRSLNAQKNELRTEVAKLNGQVYKPQTAEELEAQGVEPALAAVRALEERQQVSEFNNHVTDLNATLNTEANMVMRDFPVFDEKSPAYDATLTMRANETYKRAANIQVDQRTGMIYQVNVTPYEIYKAFADTHQAGAQSGKVTGQKASERMLAAAETPSSSAPRKAKEDPFLVGLTANTGIKVK